MSIGDRLWDRMLIDRRFTLMTVVGAASLAYKVVGVVFSALKAATFHVHIRTASIAPHAVPSERVTAN